MLTEKRDLRTGVPLWLASGAPRLAPLRKGASPRPDVVVVGTGISGALVADALLNAGYSVLAADRRKPMSGSTPASTALLQSELDTPLLELTQKLGATTAARVWWRSAQAVQALCDRIADLRIECDFPPRTTLYLPGNVLDASALKVETLAHQKLGLRSVHIGREELRFMSGINKPGAILYEGNAEADPLKLVAGLWRNFLKNGGRLANDVEVTEVDSSRGAVSLATKSGATITAKHAVFCTGYELMKFARPRGYKVISTWVLATKQQPKNLWPSKSLIWEAADPYLYMRTTADGRIIAGGEDEPFSDDAKRDALIPEKIATIARKAKKLMPHADFTAEYAWAGSFGDSPTGIPAIGPVKRLPGCYAVLGFGGNGITFSMPPARMDTNSDTRPASEPGLEDAVLRLVRRSMQWAEAEFVLARAEAGGILRRFAAAVGVAMLAVCLTLVALVILAQAAVAALGEILAGPVYAGLAVGLALLVTVILLAFLARRLLSAPAKQSASPVLRWMTGATAHGKETP